MPQLGASMRSFRNRYVLSAASRLICPPAGSAPSSSIACPSVKFHSSNAWLSSSARISSKKAGPSLPCWGKQSIHNTDPIQFKRPYYATKVKITLQQPPDIGLRTPTTASQHKATQTQQDHACRFRHSDPTIGNIHPQQVSSCHNELRVLTYVRPR